MQDQKIELDNLSEDIQKAQLAIPQVQSSMDEAVFKLSEGLGMAPDTFSELQCVIDQFGEFNSSVQEWGEWIEPAQATLEECQGVWRNQAHLEEINQKLQVLHLVSF